MKPARRFDLEAITFSFIRGAVGAVMMLKLHQIVRLRRISETG